LISHGASAFATGVHVVVIAWLAVAEFGLSTSQWGWVQAAGLLPNLLLMLVAGAWADRYDPAKVLCIAQCVITGAYLALLLLVVSGSHSFWGLLFYAMAVGSGNAFIQPVREKLLIDLRNDSIQRRISKLSITQFSLQSAGLGVAALSSTLGFVFVIFVQIGVSLLSALSFFSLRRSAISASVAGTAHDIALAIKFVKQSPGLRQLMALVAFNGYMHMGVFLVMVPFVATRNYQLNSSEYAALQLLFVLGMIVAHFALLHRKMVQFPGQGALFSLLYTALIGFGLAKGPTPFGFYSLVFLWGVVAGNSAGRCRLVLQLLANHEMRGRLMAVYQLMLFGAAPIGALVTGYVFSYLSVDRIFLFMSVSSILLFVVFLFSRTLWAIEQSEEDKVNDLDSS